ncbi:unnamed protein product [Lasius platythorax]|uniref:Uncharacterized protein n=1 Tax=Lasius platythorax TaxID=488582 RepID=A0AAV2NMT1_9HYME
MVNPACKQTSRKKQTHIEPAKRHALDALSDGHKAKSHAEFIEKILLSQGTSASTSQSETFTSPPQKIFNPESKFDTKATNNFVLNLPVTDDPNDLITYLPERKVSQELYQNTTDLEGIINEHQLEILSENLISQLNSQLPDKLFNIHIDE